MQSFKNPDFWAQCGCPHSGQKSRILKLRHGKTWISGHWNKLRTIRTEKQTSIDVQDQKDCKREPTLGEVMDQKDSNRMPEKVEDQIISRTDITRIQQPDRQ